MSLWYDVKKKIYASSPNDNWYISYIKKMCDKVNSTLSARISNHISAIAERHTASDIDYSESKTVRQALDEEISSRKSADDSNQTKIEQSVTQLQSEFKAADNTLKQALLAEDTSIRSEIESSATTLRQEFNDAVTEKSNVLTATDTQLQTQISELYNAKVDKVQNYALTKIINMASSNNNKTWNEILLSTGQSAAIPAYTSDLENDSDYVDGTYVKDARPYIRTAIPTKIEKQPVTITTPDGFTITGEEDVEVPDELSLNTIYDIGVQNDITLILPTAEVGNFIQVDFLSGATATTLTVSAASSALLSDYDFTPEPNMIYSLFFDYGVLGYDETAQSNIYGWRFSFAEYTYTPDESEG